MTVKITRNELCALLSVEATRNENTNLAPFDDARDHAYRYFDLDAVEFEGCVADLQNKDLARASVVTFARDLRPVVRLTSLGAHVAEFGPEVTNGVSLYRPAPEPESELTPAEDAARALRLVLALHETPSRNSVPGCNVTLDPKAKEQVEAALAILEAEARAAALVERTRARLMDESPSFYEESAP